MFDKEEDWEKIIVNKDIEDELQESIKKLRETKSNDDLKVAVHRIEEILHVQYCYEITQRRLYLLRKAQVRMRQIANRTINTHKFVLGIATITIAMAILLFGLMFWEAILASEADDPDERTSATILATVFGISGVGDILILMKFIMNRVQRALSDMVQTVIAYLAFKIQSDSLQEWAKLKELHQTEHAPSISLDELIKINDNLRIAAETAIIEIQKYAEDSEQLRKSETKNDND